MSDRESDRHLLSSAPMLRPQCSCSTHDRHRVVQLRLSPDSRIVPASADPPAGQKISASALRRSQLRWDVTSGVHDGAARPVGAALTRRHRGSSPFDARPCWSVRFCIEVEHTRTVLVGDVFFLFVCLSAQPDRPLVSRTKTKFSADESIQWLPTECRSADRCTLHTCFTCQGDEFTPCRLVPLQIDFCLALDSVECSAPRAIYLFWLNQPTKPNCRQSPASHAGPTMIEDHLECGDRVVSPASSSMAGLIEIDRDLISSPGCHARPHRPTT
jgi:hypothetical protein